ncbi:MAG: hypothetical protein HKN08_02385 [Gammaproteobacteria bacterium]|nr:hypothetical protein [Gammaproteobacteria bacterium]
MKNTLSRLLFTLVNIIFMAGVKADMPPPEYVQFTPSAAMGALYRPDPNIYPNPHIATLNMHRTANRLAHISMENMAARGFIILGMNPVCHNNEALCAPWENNALVVKQGIEYLKKIPGITKVVLLGGSGGGPTMSFYQAVAESGVEFCQQLQKLTKCSDALADLPPADGVVFRDAHLGNGANALRSLNPAIINDEAILNHNASPRFDTRLDPFNPENGYNPNGVSDYSDDFKETYFRAQSERMNRLIDIAEQRLGQIEAGTYKYTDDDAFVIPNGDGSRLMRLDLSIDHSSMKPRKFLKNDGTIEDCCIVSSVRPVDLSPESNQRFWSGTRMLTLRSFLSTRAIRSTHAMTEIDYCSSNNSTVCNVQNISVPVLITAMGGHYFLRNSEIFYEAAASQDKDFMVLEGAVHGITPCEACVPGGYDGRYDNSVKNYYDYVANWINERF